MNFSSATILITSGNSGIGRGLAEALQGRGAEVVITGRNPVTLAETLRANPSMRGHRLDISSPDEVVRFADSLLKETPRLNVVINNAGLMATERLLSPDLDFTVAERTVATNFLGPVHLTTALLAHLRAQDEAGVVMVSSALAFVTRADAPTYCATKAALHAWTVALRHQMADTNISVIEIVPPLVATDFSPGQADNPRAMPLADFTSEAVDLLCAAPTPREVLVERVVPQRFAERSGEFDAMFRKINPA